MLDFIEVKVEETKKGKKVYPEFLAYHTNDIMMRGNDFYAFWDEEVGMWSKSLSKLYEEIDDKVRKVAECYDDSIPVILNTYSSGLISKWKRYCKEVDTDYHELDSKVIFANAKTKKKDYISKTLNYPLQEGSIEAYEQLVSTLYNKTERRKFEWAIGSIISGDSKDIQKFYVFYGSAGSGKSTIMNIIEMLFEGYYESFSAKDLGNPSDQFAIDSFASNPLVAIDQDGDLSRLEDNSRLNKIVSHETMRMREKFKASYDMRCNTTLFMGTNNPVRITDAKSGMMRRIIDISPSGRLLSFDKYQQLMAQIPFELPGIAYHCLQVYLEYGKSYYNNYKPTKMMDETNDMFNFVQDMFWEWEDLNEVSLAKAWSSYKDWCDDSGVQYPLMKRKFKAELREYFDDFKEHTNHGDNIYTGLKTDKLKVSKPKKEKETVNWITMTEQDSLLDDILKDCKAQIATDDGFPKAKWVNCRTHMSDIDSHELHYVKPPNNHIVIDFDLKNDQGEKDPLLNLEAANRFPRTYAELSKGGSGIHLHYIYDGDVEQLSNIYDDDIEVKVFKGNSSLRRKLTKCNNVPIMTINSGLPLKGDNKVIDVKSVENERHLRALIKKSLRKEVHGHTKPEVDFIKKNLDTAYANKEMSYDVRDMRPAIITFAMNSTNQAQTCFEIVSKLHYCSEDHEKDDKADIPGTVDWNEAPIVFFDVEVFPNLFICCWKKKGINEPVNRMINPTPDEVKKLFNYRLVGFNNRRYDNHICYAKSMGYTNEELFHLSQNIVGKKTANAFFGEAYGISYTDIYDYCSNANKMSLKKWEIKLGIYHLENQYPWDEDVAEEHWEEIADYCCNDVIATEATWNATQADFRGRQILAELSGLTVNDTSNMHTQQIIFGNDRNPQRYFNYPDLSEEFPGYKFENGVSTYMGETVGEGGWVYYKPGMYYDAECEDVSGMHPASIYAMMLFGKEYTERYYDLVRARTYIKHKEYDKVKKMFDGRLAKFLGSDSEAKELSNALKTPINSVYGLTAAHFPNRCRDPRNVDNVVAKRGALFMITLKNEVEKKGYTVIHCKTDSIKLANPDAEILKFIEDFGQKYGYTFEIEDRFERICLVNKSTFIAINADSGKWEAKAAQFAHPYVFKTLFTHEDLDFNDFCETKSVSKGAMYLDMNETLPDVSEVEKSKKKYLTQNKDNTDSIDSAIVDEMDKEIAKGHCYKFVGRVGLFTPVVNGANGGVLMSSQDGEKYDAVTGTKGYRWLESETLIDLGIQDKVDEDYFDRLCRDARDAISQYGDFDIFTVGNHQELVEMLDSWSERR